MSGLTQALGEFVAGMPARQLPAGAVAAVRRGMADTVGVAFAGAHEPVVQHALFLAPGQPAGEARLWTQPAFADAAGAAFVNAVAGHALDFDDTGLDGHPSVVLAPVVLAEAERLGGDWAAAVSAYAAGYEVWAELAGRDPDKHHGKGWHPTAVFGVVASAAASACLRQLDAGRAAHGLGIAASMAAGLVANFGSMTKPLQVGFAARNGIVAAMLAERGLTSAPDALESPRGLLSALSPGGRARLDGPCRAGEPWQLLRQGLNIKRYPVCYAAHRIIDAALELHPALAHRLQDIESVSASLGSLQAAMLRSNRPTDALDAKFSAEFAVACALARGRVDLQDLTEHGVRETQVQTLLRKVHVTRVDAADAEEPLFSPDDRLAVRLFDGTLLEAAPVQRAQGHASRPIGDLELRQKFASCARAALDEPEMERWWSALLARPDEPVRWPQPDH